MAPTKTKQKTHTQHGICRVYQGREHEDSAPASIPRGYCSGPLILKHQPERLGSSLGAFPMAASVWSPKTRACARAL